MTNKFFSEIQGKFGFRICDSPYYTEENLKVQHIQDAADINQGRSRFSSFALS